MDSPSNSLPVDIDLGRVPAVPQVLLQLTEACHRADVSFDELADIVRQDAAVSAKIIAVGNSAAYAQWNEVKDLNRLLVMLGLDTIKTIAITSAVHQFFSQFSDDVGLWMGHFWRSSLACAHAARVLARLTGYEAVDEAYIAGLMHKIGQLVFLHNEPDGYAELLGRVTSDSELLNGEVRLFGVGNTEVGAALVAGLDPESFLADAVRYHAAPPEAVLESPALVKLVNLAHKLADRRADQDLGADSGTLYGLTGDVVDDIEAEVSDQVAKAAAGLGIRLDEDQAVVPESFCALNASAQVELARWIREFALLDGVRVQLDSAEALHSTLEAGLHGATLLFGFPRIACLLLDPATGQLEFAVSNWSGGARLAELSIQAEPARSLPAHALVANRPLFSMSPPDSYSPSVADEQVRRVFGTDGLVLTALTAASGPLGVLVGGIDAVAVPRLESQATLLRSFCEVVARAVVGQRLQDRAVDNERERQRAEIAQRVHEANNPLAILKNYLFVLARRLGDDEKTQEQLALLNEEVERVASIVLSMRDTVSDAKAEHGSVDVNALVEELLAVFRVSHFSTRELRERVDLDQGLVPIQTARSSLKQVLTNLLKNAVEVLQPGGEVAVSTRDKVNVDGQLFVELRVADNGPGLPGVVLEQLFKPVQSTKGADHAGLGLTIVKNLITEMGASIQCRSEAGRGTQFVILLPRRT